MAEPLNEKRRASCGLRSSYSAQVLIRPGNSPKSRPTLIPSSPANCSRKRPNGRHAPCTWPPCTSAAATRPTYGHAPCALLPMRRGTSTPSPSPSPLPARSLSRSPRSRAAVRHGQRLKLAAAAFPCLRPPSTQMDRRTTFLSPRRASGPHLPTPLAADAPRRRSSCRRRRGYCGRATTGHVGQS